MTEMNGESTSMVWPTLGSRTAKEQNGRNVWRGISVPSSAMLPVDVIIIIIIHEYYYGGAVALLLQDHLTMSVTEQSQYLSATVQREHKTCPAVNPQGNTS